MASEDTLSSNWKTLRPRLKERWHALTDDDLKLINGSRDVLMSVLCERYAYSEDKAATEINQFVENAQAHA